MSLVLLVIGGLDGSILPNDATKVWTEKTNGHEEATSIQ